MVALARERGRRPSPGVFCLAEAGWRAACLPSPGHRAWEGAWERLGGAWDDDRGEDRAFTAQRTQILKQIGFTVHKNPFFLTQDLAMKLISWIDVSQSKPRIWQIF